MSKTGRTNPRRADREAKRRKAYPRTEHAITVRSEKRTSPDLHKLSRAVIAIALAEVDAEKDRDSREEDRHDH
ncbi:hypothetical protein IRT45_05905 [Nocardia sp. BSTN01]|uniref:hypothetical protein n=1 Tax=Nocardia sp. BSTN01 TaxID=2783665 RepID=UPI00188DCA22|nr:hypothetical protein [Nocardia sp. BSTN01]MBF4996688.1 hypothetical protein [Nocardia sp. BSTN01]